ncbi:MAG: ferredoxin family protein [Planctomycetaceae bacterium]|jgi:NAD-dependent dihydropyrimidine dehydrogenase PreA subunit|nr:ferredoxin family protein [bacterium]MDC0273431.1 ferredoxin family protein [Planctomycetaceae bacterium]MDC0308527.1 ferredoxin family protein [Planctomycetaceae bacterium]MDG2388278.1 ferredoxin family protein [Planctomycetaceae bacterium]
MAGKKLTVVISQSQSKNPAHRDLEETIAADLMMSGEVEVSLVPHLYDMSRDHSGMLFLKGIPGDIVFASWLYPRAAFWTLDRDGIRGQEGITTLHDEEDEEELSEENQQQANGIGSVEVPPRKIYCLDLRSFGDAEPYLDEVKRIVSEATTQTVDLMSFIQGNPKQEQLERYLNPLPILNGNGNGTPPANGANNGSIQNGDGATASNGEPEKVSRRWYPVIDYSRCTNCMECIDFCLFGVYGVDGLDRILVDEQDNCKKGCPACSRVCPENAIIFPQHKSAAIAGAPGEIGNLKIDLSQLFGAPTALEQAALERDTELVADGRDAVGMTVGIPKRQTEENAERDDLDDMLDDLDNLGL